MSELRDEIRNDVAITQINPGVDPQEVVRGLARVIDPELGLDVVSLGLVYEVHVVGGDVTIIMTLTTPGCPLHGIISADASDKVGALPGVESVDVQLVWDPAWTPDMISEEGRRQLFWL